MNEDEKLAIVRKAIDKVKVREKCVDVDELMKVAYERYGITEAQVEATLRELALEGTITPADKLPRIRVVRRDLG